MQKAILVLWALALVALAFPGVALAAPISLNKTSASLMWTARLEWKGEKTFSVRATSSQPVSLANQDCRSNAGKNAIAMVRQQSVGHESLNGHTEYYANVSVDFGFGAGSCNVLFKSGNDHATLHLENNGRPGQE